MGSKKGGKRKSDERVRIGKAWIYSKWNGEKRVAVTLQLREGKGRRLRIRGACYKTGRSAKRKEKNSK